jgi:hypothetical protein
MKAIVKGVVEELLTLHRETLAENGFTGLPVEYWDELNTRIKFASFVVTHKIESTAAFKAAEELTNDLLQQAKESRYGPSYNRCWMIYFPESNRFAAAEDFDFEPEALFGDHSFTSDHSITLSLYRDACWASDQLQKGYKALNIPCPEIEIRYYDTLTNQPITWMSHKFNATETKN